MKTNFTKEEVCNSYIEDIIEALVTDLKMEKSAAEALIEKAEIKKSFFNDPKMYDLLEPEWVANSIYEIHIKNKI